MHYRHIASKRHISYKKNGAKLKSKKLGFLKSKAHNYGGSNYFNENQISAFKMKNLQSKKTIHAKVPDLTLIRSKGNVDLLQCFYPFRRQRVADLLEPLLGAH